MRSGSLADEPNVESITAHGSDSDGEVFEACFTVADEDDPYCVAAWMDDNLVLAVGVPVGDRSGTFDYSAAADTLSTARAEILTYFPAAIEDFLG